MRQGFRTYCLHLAGSSITWGTFVHEFCCVQNDVIERLIVWTSVVWCALVTPLFTKSEKFVLCTLVFKILSRFWNSVWYCILQPPVSWNKFRSLMSLSDISIKVLEFKINHFGLRLITENLNIIIKITLIVILKNSIFAKTVRWFENDFTSCTAL